MKTSLLNRLQSPIPTAENTPQTASIASPEISSGFAGLFQKAIGWLSPKASALDGGSNGNVPNGTGLQLNENQPQIPSGNAIAVNHTSPNPLSIASGNNGVSESPFGSVDVVNGVNAAQLINSIPTANADNLDLPVALPNLQISEEISVSGEAQAGNLSVQISSNPADQLLPTDYQESNNASTISVQNLNGELVHTDSLNEQIENNVSVAQYDAGVTSQLSLEDVVASVYAAVQTNLPSEKIEISFQPSGKNSAEITLALKNATSQNGVVAGEQQTSESLQLLETLSKHIDTFQKTVGKSATVKFGIVTPQLPENQLLSVDDTSEVLEANSETAEIPSKTIQNEIGSIVIKGGNKIVGLADTIKPSNGFLVENVQVSDEVNSTESTEKTTSRTVEPEEILIDNTVNQDANAMIAAALLSNAQQSKIETQSLETNEDSETDVPNDDSKNTVYQTEKQTSKRGKTTDVSLGISVQTDDSDAIQVSENSDIPLQNIKQSPTVNAQANTKNTAPIDSKALNGVSIDASLDSAMKSEVENGKVSNSQKTAPEYTTSDNSNGIQQAKVNENPQTNGKHEANVQSSVVHPQVNISDESVPLDRPDTQENIGMSLPLKGNNNTAMSVQKENTAQSDSILEASINEPVIDLQIPNVLSNQKTTDSNSTPIKAAENPQTAEIQKQSFNSVRELLDASAKNGITVSGLVIRVDTPEMQAPVNKMSIEVIQQTATKNNEIKLDVSKNVSTINSVKSDDVETEVLPTIEGKLSIAAKQSNTPKTNKLQSEVLKSIVPMEQELEPLSVQTNTPQAVVTEPVTKKLSTPNAEVSIPNNVKSATPQVEPLVQNSAKIDSLMVETVQSVTNETDVLNVEHNSINAAISPQVNPKKDVLKQIGAALDSVETELPKSDTQIAEPITMKSDVAKSELPKQKLAQSGIQNLEVPQQVELKSDTPATEQSKPISTTVDVPKASIAPKMEGNSLPASSELPETNTSVSGVPTAKVVQLNSVKQPPPQVEHGEINVSESGAVNDQPSQSVGVKADATKKEAVKLNSMKKEAPAVELKEPVIVKSDIPKTEEINVEATTLNSSKVEVSTSNVPKVETTESNTPKVEASTSKSTKVEVSNSTPILNPKIGATLSNGADLTAPKANKTSEVILSNDAIGAGVKPETAVKTGVAQSNSFKEEAIKSPKSEITETNPPKSAMQQGEMKQSDSTNETANTTEKVETPKVEKSKSDAIKLEVTEREIPASKAQQLPSEQTSTTVQSQDVSAIASAQKSTAPAKTEHKNEKRIGKTDAVEATASSAMDEQLPKQVTERNPMNQNEQQKQDDKQQLPLGKKNFETTIAQEVQQGETATPKEENISNADSIRAKASVELNNPNPTTNTALFQQVVAPNKNYQSADSAKKSIPRVDVDSFAPATAQLVRTMPQQTGGSVRMQLTPDALGAVTVQVNVRDKNAALRIDVETTAAKQALEAQIPLLREQMAQQGITTERIEIQVRPREDFSMFSGFNQQNSSAKQEEQQARQSYLRSFGDGREDRQDNPITQEILPKVKDKKSIIQNRVEFYA